MRELLKSRIISFLLNIEEQHTKDKLVIEKDIVFALKYHTTSILYNHWLKQRFEWLLNFIGETEDEALILKHLITTIEDTIQASLFKSIGNIKSLDEHNARIISNYKTAVFIADFIQDNNILVDNVTLKLINLIRLTIPY
jgi:hypothetical protein